MIGKHIGPFTILRELGTGGMGTVYLAETGDTERRAIKVVHPHLIATPGFFKRFLREAELGKQVKHESVVRTLDVDATMVDGQQINYMVMEYVEGRSLRDLLRDLGTVPETLLREVALQMAAGLAAIHAEGIVHRDLKPENVMITDDHRVRIMDLGVAKLQEASVALTREGQFAGSFLYAAPEQFQGGDVGPAADLYSLGVILHELATGDNPFRHEETAAVIQAHLNQDPPPADERNQDLSAFICEVLATLLRKRPADRFESAATLGNVLTEAERSGWWVERAARTQAKKLHLPRIQVRRETRLHARDAEMKLLSEAWSRVREGEGSTILIEGEAGIGKTRLVDEFVRGIGGGDAHVLYGSYPLSGGLGGLSDSIIGKFGETNLEDAIRPYLTVTPMLVPGFAALIRHESLPTGAEPLQGDALHAVGCHLARALAAEKPTVWILEDMHNAPAGSRHLVLALARALGAHRVLLIATTRPGLPDDEVAEFGRLPSFRRLQLGRLGARDVVELLRDAFKSESLAEKLGVKIAYKSDGVPFFIFEMFRALRDGNLITQQPDGEYVQTQLITDIEVPSAVKDLIEARMRGLSREQRAILDVGAVQGMTFEPALVAAVLEEKKVRVLQEIAEVERRFGLVRGEASACRFDQNQVQEVLYQGLLPELRAEYHTLLAEARGDKGDPYFLAIHHLRGSRPESAKPHLPHAFKQLQDAYRSDAHVELSDLALATAGLFSDQERCEALIAKGRLHGNLGQRQDEGAAIEEAVRLADAIGDATLRCDARSRYGWHLWALGQYPESQAVCEEALAIARAAGDAAQERLLGGRLASVLSTLGHQKKALELHQSENNRGLCFQYLGRYAEARDCLAKAIEASRETKDRTNEGIGLVNLGRLQAALGDPEGGRATLERSREILRAIGQRRPESYALHRLGAVAEQVGDHAEAARYYEQALALRREIDYPSGITETLLALGRLKGSPDLLRQSQTIAREIDRPDEIVLCAVYLGDGAEEALASFGERMRFLEKTEAHFALWNASKRPDHLEEARRLHEHLLAHAPEECREAMVRNVPLHRRIVEASNDRK